MENFKDLLEMVMVYVVYQDMFNQKVPGVIPMLRVMEHISDKTMEISDEPV